MSPTSSPATIVADARRTSPGFSPYCWALARSTVTWMWGTSVWSSGFRSAMPLMSDIASVTSSAFSRSVARSVPKIRTTMASPEPVSTSSIRSPRYVSVVLNTPG